MSTKIDANRRADRRKSPSVGSLTSRVTVCTTLERPDGDVSTLVDRPGVIQVHASVRPLRGVEVLNWKAVTEVYSGLGGTRGAAPTHEIVIRDPPDVKVDLNHWVFCRDRYSETWYKVRFVEDMGGVHRFLTLLCTIETVKDRRSDPATQPLPPTWETPDEPVVDRV